MILWYLFSAFNLFANKFILSYLKGDPALLGKTYCIVLVNVPFIFNFLFSISNQPNADVHNTGVHSAQVLMWPLPKSPPFNQLLVLCTEIQIFTETYGGFGIIKVSYSYLVCGCDVTCENSFPLDSLP